MKNLEYIKNKNIKEHLHKVQHRCLAPCTTGKKVHTAGICHDRKCDCVSPYVAYYLLITHLIFQVL